MQKCICNITLEATPHTTCSHHPSHASAPVTAADELETKVRIYAVPDARFIRTPKPERHRHVVRAFFVSPENKAAAASRVARHEV